METEWRWQGFYSPNRVRRDLESLEKSFGDALQALAGEWIPILANMNLWSLGWKVL